MSAIAELTKPLPEVEPSEPMTPTLKDEGFSEAFELAFLRLLARDIDYRDELAKSHELDPRWFLEGNRRVAEYFWDLATKYPGASPSAIHFYDETKDKRGGPKDEAEATRMWARVVPPPGIAPKYPDKYLKEKIGEYFTSIRLEAMHTEALKILRTKGLDEAEIFLKKAQSQVFQYKDIEIFGEGGDSTHLFRRFKDLVLALINYLLDKNLPLGILAMLLSPGGIGKSTLLEQLCLCVAGGIMEFLPGIFDLKVFGDVLMLNAEDGDNYINGRFQAFVDYLYPDDPFAEEPKRINGLTKEEFLANVYSHFHCITETALATAKSPAILYDAEDHKNGYKAQKNWEAFVAKCLRIPNLKLIVIDPLNQFFAGDENSADDMGAFMMLLKHLAHKTGAVVLVSHHTNKWSQSNTAGDRAASSKLSPEASRGSSAAVNAARWVLQLANCNRQEMAKKTFSLHRKEVFLYSHLSTTK